jgi:hypothetical protein
MVVVENLASVVGDGTRGDQGMPTGTWERVDELQRAQPAAVHDARHATAVVASPALQR